MKGGNGNRYLFSREDTGTFIQYTDPNHEGSILHKRSSENCETATDGNDGNVRGRIPHASLRTLISQRLLFDVISAPRRENFSSLT